MKKLSAGSRLTIWYLTIFLLAEVIFSASMYVIVRENIFAIADSIIEGQAADLQRFLEGREKISPAQLQSEIAENFRVERSRDYLQIADANGNLVYRSPFLEEHPLPAVSFEDLDRPIYENRKLGSDRFRFLSRQMDVSGRTYLVRIGHPMQEESKTLADVRAYSLWLGLLFLVGVAAGGYWLSCRAP